MLQIIAKPKHQIILVSVVAFISRLIYVLLIVDPQYDGYSRFLKGIYLISNPYDFNVNWVWPPLFQYLNAALYWLTHSYLTVRVFSTICGTSSVLLTYKLTLRISKSEKAALVASSLMTFNPLTFFYDTTGMTQALFTLLFLLAIYLFVDDHFLVASIPLALACLIRYEAWFLALIFYILVLVQKRQKLRTVILSSLFPLFAVLSWIYINYIVYGNAFYFLQGFDLPFPPEAYLLRDMVALLSPVWYIIVYFVFLTPQVFLQAIRGLMKCIKQVNDNLTLPLLVFSYIFFLTFFAITKSLGYLHYSLPLIPLFITYASYHMVNKGNSIQIKKFLTISLTISVVMLSAITIWATNYMQPTIQTSNWIHENAKTGRILCAYEPIIILSDMPFDRFVLLWERNIAHEDFLQFLATHNIKYIVSNYGIWSSHLSNFTRSFVSERQLFMVYIV